ncbi:hypothetical protein J8I87_03685 [Paraburkholderia sp. LEh10]|uniref:hypothetical protein n=1 Tax=Paraburkholderia sp. LEh10 TaxID=2821353 RepID=UPI001AEB48E4|nr:hypothetical protein [Paraburkholderia sp. LEh10]MBP0588835.1 hypothetical protein [Paraburkholderia sp. LEh10]
MRNGLEALVELAMHLFSAFASPGIAAFIDRSNRMPRARRASDKLDGQNGNAATLRGVFFQNESGSRLFYCPSPNLSAIS